MAQVADSVNALADALAVSESREREFLLSVTHELRTPLTAVKGFAEAVADGVATGDAARQAGAVILAESTRLEHLIGDLLDLARLGAKDFSITPGSGQLDRGDGRRGDGVAGSLRRGRGGVHRGPARRSRWCCPRMRRGSGRSWTG